MLTVTELIQLLNSMPQAAPVFAYCGDHVEGDGPVENVVHCTRDSLYEDDYQMAEYGCNADSRAALYLLDHEDIREIVVLGEIEPLGETED